jgi:hypothetical protein
VDNHVPPLKLMHTARALFFIVVTQ